MGSKRSRSGSGAFVRPVFRCAVPDRWSDPRPLNPSPLFAAEPLERRLLLAHNITIASGGLTTIPAGASLFDNQSDYVIDPIALNSATSNVNLDATNDITFQSGFAIANAGVAFAADAQQQIIQSAAIGTNGGDILLASEALPLTLGSSVNAGIGTVRIESGGAVTQTATAVIAAANLGIQAGGNIDLSQASNAVSGFFAAATSASGAVVRLVDTGNLTVGTITASGPFPTTSGVASTNGDVTLAINSGGLTLTQAVNAGVGSIRLDVNGSVAQTATGILTGTNLGVIAAGNVDLTAAPSQIASMFAGLISVSGASLAFLNGPGFTVGTVTADSIFPNTSGATTSNGDVTLMSQSGAITLAAPVNTGSGTARLASAATITQTASGTISAANLGLIAAGNIDLAEGVNFVNGTFAASNSGSGAFLHFIDGPGFTVGTVAADPTFARVIGIGIVNANISMVSQQSQGITLTEPINAGTGIVRLNSSGGGVTQTASGAVNAGCLLVVASGNVVLNAANTIPVIFAAMDTPAAGGPSIQFNDTSAFTVNTIPTDGVALGAIGITTNNGNITLTTSGALTINSPINAGSGALSLASAGVNDAAAITAGTIAQQSAGSNSVYGGALRATGPGGISLAGQSFSITGNVTVDAAPLAISNAGTSTISGVVSGAGLNKGGAGTLLLTASQTLSGGLLSIAGGLVTITAPAASNTVSSLTLSGGMLDLGTSRFYINYSAPDPVSTVRSYLQAGSLFSSSSDPSHALGFADGADNIVTGLSPGFILIRYTFRGDANLDGSVNFSDLVILAQHYNSTTANWDEGDFDYNGSVNFADLVALAQNYGQTMALSPLADGVPATGPAASFSAATVSSVAGKHRQSPIHRPHRLRGE